MSPKHSFTLIELLVVIAIIGILAGVIIVSMSGATDSATLAKAKVFANSMRDSMGNNMVSEWRFDGSGVADGAAATTAYTQDTWSSGNNGTIVGTPFVYSGSSCVSGSCLQFNNTDRMNVGNNSSLNIKDNITLSLWIKASISTPSGWVNFINSNSNGNCDSGSYCIRWSGARLYSHYYGDSSSAATYISQNLINDNKWHFLTSIYDGANIYLYLDGAKKMTGSLTGQLRNIPNVVSIGNPGTGYSEMIDDIRIFNIAMPTSQIKQQYFAGLQQLVTNGEITRGEYDQRIADLEFNISQK
jgi:prepilin-type N-terminal cleavage/methylation domain-containing protein